MKETTHLMVPFRNNIKGIWTRIENIHGGPPDLHGFSNGHEVWVEAKILRGSKFRLQNNTRVWFEKRREENGLANCWFLFRRGELILCFNAAKLSMCTMEPLPNTKAVQVNVPSYMPWDFKCRKPWAWRTLELILFPEN